MFAVTAGAFVPLNYMAVNLSTAYVHPRVFSSTSNLPGSMALTLLVSLLAMALLFATLCKYELTAKHARAQLRRLRRQLTEDPEAPVRRSRSAAPAMYTARTAGRAGA